MRSLISALLALALLAAAAPAAAQAPRQLVRPGGFLSGPSADDPVQVARGYVSGHAAALGLDANDVARLEPARSYTSPIGVTHVTFAQTYGGIPAFDSFVRVNVARGGRVLNVVGSPASDVRVASTTPGLTARAARSAAMRDAGVAGSVPGVDARRAGPERRTTFEDDQRARLVIFGGTRLAWFVSAVGDAVYVVDARDGRVLWRESITHSADGTAWDYYPVDRGSPADGHTQSLRTFPAAWLADGATTLDGPNAHVYTDVADDNLASASDEIAASSPGSWNHPATLRDSGVGCAALAPCTWDSATPRSWQTNLKQNATQVFYFVNSFHDWLAAPPFGFDSASGSFDGADSLEAQTLDGADTSDAPGGPPVPGGGFPDVDHVDNANMSTPPDGQRPRMQMFLFPGDPTRPDYNGGDDAAVVYHEYTHGLSNRLVTYPVGASALVGHQSDSMGEGWSDWYAMDHLYGHGFDAGPVNFGYFANGSRPNRPDGTTLRSQPMNCVPGSGTSTDGAGLCMGSATAGDGGYTYGDLGKVVTDATGAPEPEVHGDGEIWGQTLWQLRDRLVADLGGPAGLDRARLLVTEGMRLSPPAPSFLDMRDAILAADTANGGSDAARISEVFAQRGMGYLASTTGSDDVAPVEDFSLPPADQGDTPEGTDGPPAADDGARAGTSRRVRPVRVPRQRLRKVLSRGLVVRVTPDQAGRATVAVRLDKRTARRVGHKGLAGRATRRISTPGRTVKVRVRLARLDRSDKRALRHQRAAGFGVRVRLAPTDGSATTLRRHIRLRR